jgi:predicted HicB family RNase H-like nuclease
VASAMVQVNVRVPPELHTRLVAHAAATTTTVTAVVTEALKSYFEQGGKGK